jgi:hypothetical protein
VKAQYDSGGSPGTLLAEYRYDGLNRRIAKMLPAQGCWDRTDYYNEAWQVLEERQDADPPETKDEVQTTTFCQYIWDIRYVDAPLVRLPPPRHS